MRKLLALAIVLAVALTLVGVWGGTARAAGHCDVTVVAPASIQAAVDAATAGDTICLSGTFSSVSTVTISTSDITITSASPAVLTGGSGPAFRLADGLDNVTIKELEIENRTGIRGGGIEAWNVTTSNITVRNNYLHDNDYIGVLVGSNGSTIHANWMVKNNKVENNGFIGIELTNCQSCTIMKNDVDGGLFGIVVQARNTVAGSGLVTINGVNVLHNSVDDPLLYGIYVLSFTGNSTTFAAISGASSLLSSVNVSHNTVTDPVFVAGIRFWTFNSAATARNGRIMKNEVSCLVTSVSAGIQLLESGIDGPGTVENVKVVRNTIDDDCSPQYTDQGDNTKLPPGLGPYPGA